ncbi:MAG: hypothetical protein ACK6DM_14405 [Alphaproteobacteria bacterium]|jgi:hypothetical protein
MRLRRLVPVCLLAALAAVWVAEARGVDRRLISNKADGIVYALPKQSPFKVEKASVEGLTFKGRAVISGTYVFGRNAPAAEEMNGSKEPDLYFIPDAASAALLPRWKEDGVIDGVYISNRDDFFKAVIAPGMVQKVKAGKVRSLTGPLTIEVEGYFATVICGMPAYGTRFVRVATPPQVIAANRHAETVSCKG